MLLTVKEAARRLRRKPHQVYYLMTMGEIVSVQIGKAWRLTPEAVEEYARRFPRRTDREPAGNFVYPGNGGFLFGTLPDYTPPHPQGKTAGVERRRGQLVHSADRPETILRRKLKPATQMDLFAI